MNMAQYYVRSEHTEDTFDCTDNLQDAMRIAREVAQKGEAGDPVCIQLKGMNIMQFVLLPNGKIAEETLLENQGPLSPVPTAPSPPGSCAPARNTA
jgi:hypothetical protein